MKHLKLIVVSFLLFSCTNNKSTFDSTILIGNWASLNKEIYQEYYFDGDDMYIYDIYSDNILQYHYTVNNDSIFRYFVHPELKDNEYKFYSRAVKFDSNQINLRNKTLYRLKDNNTLEMYINKKIDSKIYNKSCISRASLLSPDGL
jgi:hypothetical protein